MTGLLRSATSEGGSKTAFTLNQKPALLFLAVLFLGYAVYAIDRTVLAAVLKPMSAALALTDPEKGLLSAAVYIGVLAVVFLAGSLSDRYGTRRIILAGVLIFTLFTWLVALSTTFIEAFFFRLVSGLGEGLFWPVAMAAIANYFKARKGIALGLFYVGFDVGQTSGLAIGGATYALTSDWRVAFLYAPVAGIAVIAGIFLASSTFDQANSKVGRLALGRDAIDLMRRRAVALIMLFALLATWSSVWQVAFLPYYYSNVLAVSTPLAAFLAATVAASGGVGKIVLGYASDRWRRDRMLASISALTLVLYAVFFAATNVYAAAITAVAMGFFTSAIFPVMQSLMADSCDGKTGTGLGLTTTAQSVAAVFSTTITGYLLFLGVGNASALTAMIPAALMLVVSLFIGDPRGRDRQQ
jgi:predicted MFS family arabinose efflux permease